MANYRTLLCLSCLTTFVGCGGGGGAGDNNVQGNPVLNERPAYANEVRSASQFRNGYVLTKITYYNQNGIAGTENQTLVGKNFERTAQNVYATYAQEVTTHLDDNGSILGSVLTERNLDPTFLRRGVWHYRSDGLAERVEFFATGSQTTIVSVDVEYDTNGRVVKTTKTLSDNNVAGGAANAESECFVWSGDVLVKSRLENAVRESVSSPSFLNYYTMDSAGRIIRVDTFFETDETKSGCDDVRDQSAPFFSKELKYDDYGNLVELTQIAANERLLLATYEYAPASSINAMNVTLVREAIGPGGRDNSPGW